MIQWVFAGGTLLAVGFAALAGSLRLAIIALWLGGLSIGALYLTLGAELLAVLQWIVSTMVAISFVFFAMMFGESGSRDAEPRRSGLLTSVGFLLGGAFTAIVWLAARRLPQGLPALPPEGNDLASLGQKLVQEHFVSLEILALTLFVALVGAGILARPVTTRAEKGDQP